MARLQAERCSRILVVPLYPQYAASTTASVMDAVFAHLMRVRVLPELRWVRHFHDHPSYIDALAHRVKAHWAAQGSEGHLVMSFHGLPRYTVDRGDPYYYECLETARLLAARLELRDGQWSCSFQSRFGRAPWLEPYTVDVLSRLARSGVGRVDVIAPGFVADCLETLEELGMEGRALFMGEGGRDYHVIPCLNDDPAWVQALAGIVEEQLAGFLPQAERSTLLQPVA